MDRSGDAIKHGNYAGSDPNGGVLVLAGDDHGARSSTLAHQSDHAFIHYGMPILNPSSVSEFLEYGLLGFGLSRYAGCWVGFKCITDLVESGGTVAVDPATPAIVLPQDFEMPDGGLNILRSDTPLGQEARALGPRLDAAPRLRTRQSNGSYRPWWAASPIRDRHQWQGLSRCSRSLCRSRY